MLVLMFLTMLAQDLPISSKISTLEELSTSLPGYSFKELIAQYDVGALYHAVQLSLDRDVAIKILPADHQSDPSKRRGFYEEALAMGQLSHRNLVSVYDFGLQGEYYFMIMEFVNGCSLYDAVAGSALEDTQAVEIMSALCEGLEYAHKSGVLHRDIEPAHVLLTMECIPKLTNFSLENGYHAPFLKNAEGMGKIKSYKAPEVLRSLALPDERSDIYSLGAVLYFLLTSADPQPQRVPASHYTQSARELDHIIDRAMHPDVSMRYGSCAELKQDLEAFLEYRAELDEYYHNGGHERNVENAGFGAPEAPQVGIAGAQFVHSHLLPITNVVNPAPALGSHSSLRTEDHPPKVSGEPLIKTPQNTSRSMVIPSQESKWPVLCFSVLLLAVATLLIVAL